MVVFCIQLSAHSEMQLSDPLKRIVPDT